MKKSKYKIYKQTFTNVMSESLPKKIEKHIKKFSKLEQGKYSMKRRGIDSIYYHKYLLHTKQILKSYYGNISEKEFKKIYNKSITNKSSDYFMSLLELRLQTVIYRLGFASSFKEARHLIVHGHIMVNKRIVTYPGYNLKIKDIIEPANTSRDRCYNNIIATNRPILDHLFIQKNVLVGIITQMPKTNRIPYPKPFRMLDFSQGNNKDLAKTVGLVYTNSPLYDLTKNQFYNIYTT
jgi:small subunit ribosomal protein S4